LRLLLESRKGIVANESILDINLMGFNNVYEACIELRSSELEIEDSNFFDYHLFGIDSRFSTLLDVDYCNFRLSPIATSFVIDGISIVGIPISSKISVKNSDFVMENLLTSGSDGIYIQDFNNAGAGTEIDISFNNFMTDCRGANPIRMVGEFPSLTYAAIEFNNFKDSHLGGSMIDVRGNISNLYIFSNVVDNFESFDDDRFTEKPSRFVFLEGNSTGITNSVSGNYLTPFEWTPDLGAWSFTINNAGGGIKMNSFNNIKICENIIGDTDVDLAISGNSLGTEILRNTFF